SDLCSRFPSSHVYASFPASCSDPSILSLALDHQPRMLMTRPRSHPVSRLLAVSRQSHRFHLSPQFLLRLFSLSMQNYRMLPSLSDALFSFLVTPVISVISSFAVLCIVSEK